MKNPLRTQFAAVFSNEVLLASKRVAPYVLMVLFAANAALWWARGPAVARGWATNSEFYIRRNLVGFSFILGLPIFTAIMMGAVVVRDFRLGLDPLIFSKPMGRASYLLGKFFGNFFVLVCCQAAFPIAFCLLQWVPYSGMVKQPWRVVPFFKHFFIMVVISHLVLAAFYFAAGTLSRNEKIVYVLAACFYPVYIAINLTLAKLPETVRVLLDPLGFGITEQKVDQWTASAEFLNNLVGTYGTNALVNRTSMIAITALFLLIVYLRFTIEPLKSKADPLTRLTLSEASGTIAYRSDPVQSYGLFDVAVRDLPTRDLPALPRITSTRGTNATLFKILAAVGVEFRLLRSERSLIVLFSLVILLCFINLPPYSMATDVSYSVMFATHSANTLLLLLTGLIVFYTGEAMHRDRELKTEPVIWSTPVTNSVLLLSKCFAMVCLVLVVVAIAGLITIATQLLRGHALEVTAYFLIFAVVLVPGLVFVTTFVIALNVVLRNKYVTYVVATATGAGLVYLYNMGYNHWLYNPVLYRLWNYAHLTSSTTLAFRLYCLALAAAFLAVAQVLFERRST
jgi:ABC-2 type transport system permease protein